MKKMKEYKNVALLVAVFMSLYMGNLSSVLAEGAPSLTSLDQAKTHVPEKGTAGIAKAEAKMAEHASEQQMTSTEHLMADASLSSTDEDNHASSNGEEKSAAGKAKAEANKAAAEQHKIDAQNQSADHPDQDSNHGSEMNKGQQALSILTDKVQTNKGIANALTRGNRKP